MLTKERLEELFYIDVTNGSIVWKQNKHCPYLIGKEAGHKTKQGYKTIMIDGKAYGAHTLIWFYHTGNMIMTPLQIDHINRIRNDNKISNLRVCTNEENHQNRIAKKTSKSGFLGVTWDKQHKKWRSQLMYKGKFVHRSLHNTPEEAHNAYLEAKKQHHTFCPVPRV